jgi:exosortase/archaeosortase family protein
VAVDDRGSDCLDVGDTEQEARVEPFLKRPALLAAAQLIAFWPVWWWYTLRLGAPGDERWGLLVLVAAALMWLRSGTLDGDPPPVKSVAVPGLWPSVLLTLLYAASYAWLPPIFRAAIAVTAAGCTLSYCRGRRLQPGIAGLLLLALPVIPSLQFVLGYPLRVAVGWLAAPMLNLAGFAVFREGTCLNWGGELIAIDAPCSGVRMLWAALFLTFVVADLYRLGWVRTGLASMLALVAVLLGNTLRAAGLFYIEAGIIKLPSWSHEGAGVIVFLATAVGIVSGIRQIRRVISCAQPLFFSRHAPSPR